MVKKIHKIFKNLLKRFQVLHIAHRSKYNFSTSDYWLYLRHAEYPGSIRYFPTIQVVGQDGEYVQLQIKARKYFWPSAVDWKALAWMHQEVFVSAAKNAHAYEFAGARMQLGDRVVDAGASEGFFTHYALQRNANVLALEPFLSFSNALRKTFEKEISKGQVKVLSCALGMKPGRGKLEINQGHPYESHIGETGIEIEVVSLDNIMDQEYVDFIKMDIEGSEMDAIRGGSELIARCKPRLAIAVYHKLENAYQVCCLLRQIRPDYKIRYRGIYAWESCDPRPFMVYAW